MMAAAIGSRGDGHAHGLCRAGGLGRADDAVWPRSQVARQRVSIARALALNPQVLICDAPLSALDVSVRAQIVNLFARLQEQLGLTILIVAHDLAIVREVCSGVTVMYLGRVAEQGVTKPLFADPAHPYTQALLSAVPSPDPRIEATRPRILLAGDPAPVQPAARWWNRNAESPNPRCAACCTGGKPPAILPPPKPMP